MEWIKFVLRPTTEEEKEEFNGADYYYDCEIPDEEEFVAISDGVEVWVDQWMYDSQRYYLESGSDAEGLYWMSLPEPPKKA